MPAEREKIACNNWGNIEVTTCTGPKQVAEAAAARVIFMVNAKPDLVMCLPTGRTPLSIYRKLVSAYRHGQVSFAKATILSIDEYLGCGLNDAHSFATYMVQNFYRHIDVNPQRTHIPNGRAPDHLVEARRYEELIHSLGGIDFIMLGVGINGHLGFNEPGSNPDSTTRVVDLAPETLAANRADLPKHDQDQIPSKAITIGLHNIMSAGSVLLVACGRKKAEPIRQLLGDGSVAEWPIAILRQRESVELITDIARELHQGRY